MTYILASNMAEMIPFLAMVALKIPPALVIMQILAVDLGTDMLPALALGGEQPEPGLLRQPPRSSHQTLLDRSVLLRAYGFLGLMEAMLSMGAFFVVWWSHDYHHDPSHHRGLSGWQRLCLSLRTRLHWAGGAVS